MGVERKQLYRFILGAFRSNEDVERFLRDQDGYGDKMANAVPNPRVDREEYAFEVADRLVRWGYTSDYLEAVLADEQLGIASRRGAAEMLGRDPWGVTEFVGEAVGADRGRDSGVGAGSVVGTPSTTTALGATPTPSPNSPPQQELGPTELWTLYLERADRPTIAAVQQLEVALRLELGGLQLQSSLPMPAQHCAGYYCIDCAVPSDQAEFLRAGILLDDSVVDWKLVAAHPKVNEQSPQLHVTQVPNSEGCFRIHRPGGFSQLVSEKLSPPSFSSQGVDGTPKRPKWDEELRWYLEKYASEAPSAPDTQDVANEAQRRKDVVEEGLNTWTEDIFSKLTQHPLAKEWFTMATELHLYVEPGSAMQSWPWECMAIARHVVFQNKPVLRTASPSGPPAETPSETIPPSGVLRILLICPRASKDPVGYRAVSEDLLWLVRNAGGMATLTELSPATSKGLQELADQETRSFDIVHFDGHGLKDGRLMFELGDDDGLGAKRVDTLESYLGRLGVKVVVMTACSSAASSKASLASSADTLIRTAGGRVAEVVAMGWQLHSDGARHFLDGFYRELFSRRSAYVTVAGAIRAGRLSMLDNPMRSRKVREDLEVNDAIVPRHYIREKVRFSVARPKNSRQPPPPYGCDIFGVDHANSSPSCGLIGRDHELHQMTRWWTRPGQDCMVIEGPTGVGKRTLITWWLNRLHQTGHLGADEETTGTIARVTPRIFSAKAEKLDAFYLAIGQQLNLPAPRNRELGCLAISNELRPRSILFWEGLPGELPEDDFNQLMQFAQDLSRRGHRLVLICPQFPQGRETSLRLCIKPFSEAEAIEFVGKVQGRPVEMGTEILSGAQYLPAALREVVPAGQRWRIGGVRRHAM